MKEFLKKHRAALVLFVIILVQLAYITYVFAFKKENFHQDDAWSYQFANANYDTGMGIVTDGDGNNTYMNEWTDSKVFKEFVEVQDGMQFHFDSVLCNMAIEKNPPLHSILLHAVCSFFPNTFSWWYGYAINVFSFVFTMIALYFLAKEMTLSKKVALVLCLFYGFTTGALSTFLLLRPYALHTGLAVLLLYLHCRMHRKQFQKTAPQLIAIFLIMVIGCLNHYSLMMFGFILTALFGIYALCKKRWKFAFIYGGVMAASVVVVMLLWHQAFNLLLSANDQMYGTEMPLMWEVQECLRLLFSETLGIPFQFPSIVFWTYVEIVLIYVVLFASGISFLLRNEERFRKLVKKVWGGIRGFFKKLPGRFLRMDKIYLLSFVACTLTLILVTYLCNVYIMGEYADRYLFFLMPIIIVILAGGIYQILKRFIKKRKWLNIVSAVLLIGVMVLNHVIAPTSYLFPRFCEGPRIEELTKDAHVILVPTNPYHLVYYSPILRESASFFMVPARESMEAREKIDQLEETDKPVYLIVSNVSFLDEAYERDENLVLGEDEIPAEEAMTCGYKVSQLTEEYSKISWATKCEFIQAEWSFLGVLSVYQLR